MPEIKDGLVNVATGLGTERSKLTHSRWNFNNLNNYPAFEAAYESSWLARRIVDTVAEDACKDWRRIKCKSADEIRIAEDDMQVIPAVRDAMRWARLYGGCGIIMITDQPMDKPLDVNRIKKGSLKGLRVLDRYYLGGTNTVINDVLNPDFMRPDFFLIAGSPVTKVHTSHVVKFVGEPLPMRRMIQQFGWGDSSLRQVLEPVEELISSISGVAESLQEFNIDIIKREGLFSDLDSDQDEAIQKRFETFGLMKSIVHLALLDGSEEFDRKAVNYAGVADMMRMIMHQVSGASHIPFTRLFGASAEGMDATGDGDDKNYTDYLTSLKNSRLDPALRQLDEVLVRSALGTFPSDFNYDWGKLERKGATDEATRNKTRAEMDQIYLDNGVITVSQIQRNLQSEETYSFDEDRIKELEDYESKQKVEDLYGTGAGTEEAEEGGFGAVPEDQKNSVPETGSEPVRKDTGGPSERDNE